MKQYIVDAFTNQLFRGNPAAVCVIDAWPSEELMMAITKENRFSETAFAVREGDAYGLRWFTPGGEIDLCGHATLATAYVILRFYEPEADSVVFDTKSGRLTVTREGERYAMDFPAYDLHEVPVTDAMAQALGARPTRALLGRDLVAVFADEAAVRALEPDLEKVAALDGLLCNVTAPGTGGVDSVSRTFAPKLKVVEDPVCGSGHCHIAPFWAQERGVRDLVCYQASARGGTLYCRVQGDRVRLAGEAVLYSAGEVLPDA